MEIVDLGFWVFGHGNRFVDRWVWVSCSFSVRNSLKKKNRSVVVVVVVVLRLRLREAFSRSAFFAASHAVSSHFACTGVEVDRELVRRDILIFRLKIDWKPLNCKDGKTNTLPIF